MDENCDRASILRLPEELLNTIVQEACRKDKDERDYEPWEYWSGRRIYWGEHFRTPISLCLVCRRLNRIAMPYLYGDVVLGRGPWGRIHIESQDPTIKLMHRSYRSNPDLWKLCRSLKVGYRGYNDHGEAVDWPMGYIVNDLTAWMTETRSFRFTGLGHDSADAWRICLQGMRNFQHLEELSLGGRGNDIDVVRLFGVLNEMGCAKLRTLALSGVSFLDNEAGNKRPKLEPGTASLTTLRLYCFLVTPQILEDLMRWTPKLERFRLDFTYPDHFGAWGIYPWSLATLQPILSIHRKSLHSIRISHLERQGLQGFDMRQFERLEELSLAACTMFGHIEPPPIDGDDIARLLAPSLRRFRFDLTYEDQQVCEALDYFGYAQENWLRCFAHMAVQAKCPLREIRVQFFPEGFRGDTCKQCVYPWDRMDALGRELEPEGIQVHYNPPSTSREEWLEQLQRSHDWDDDRLCVTCTGECEDSPDTFSYLNCNN